MAIDAAIDALTIAHNGIDNFYNEPGPARALEALVGPEGNIPEAVSPMYVRAVVTPFLGNGYGVSRAAIPAYTRMIGSFGPREAGRALRAFTDPQITSVLWSSAGRKQWPELLNLLEPKLTRPAYRELYDAVRTFSGTPDRLADDPSIARLAMPRRRSANEEPRASEGAESPPDGGASWHDR